MIQIEKYEPKYKALWDKFVTNSKNGVFLFYRDYMEYHSDRFTDFSLMFFKGNNLIGLMPANIKGDTLFSHGGLTFGGIVSNHRMTAHLMLKIFAVLREYLRSEGVEKIVYKVIPHIYHSVAAEEDLYALFRNNAKLFRRDIASAIYLPEKISFQETRLRCIKKAESANVKVKKVDDFKTYWKILEENLAKRHNTKPTHSIEEIECLHNKFPNNIKLFATYQNDKMLAGVVIYESNNNVAHAQYIANSEDGRKIGALDRIFAHLINKYRKNKKYFDFGISTENEGRYLNKGLIFFKEGFGARSVVYDFYELST